MPISMLQVFQIVCILRSDLVHFDYISEELSWNIEINIYNKEADKKHLQQPETSFYLLFTRKCSYLDQRDENR